MDVRHFAFLARQPSAALKPRDSFFGLPKRGLVLILANALFWQPLLAQAGGIVVSAPGTTVGQAGNGVPVVNIATPNGSGLSHNQFKDYNVGPNGVILNNANGPMTNTQLGGYIVGNPNLKGGAASVILNEVNGGSPSQLRGYTEVAGQSAKVIVANPYGVTCSGCGFINTPNVTLTTGKPVLDASGQLQRYQVDGGAVTIDGQGLNASNVDRFEIITRSAKINAQINARELTVIAGRNDVDAKSLKATARADDGSAKPELAIDSSALGGMYAGAIKLVGTEAGVGVKLDGTLAASGGDIQLDANGRLSMAQTATTGNLKVTAQNVNLTDKVYAAGNVQVSSAEELVNQKSLAAGQRIELNATTVTNPGIIEAGVQADNSRNATGDVVVNTQTLNTSGNVLASRSLSATATRELNNQGAVIQGKTVTLNSARLTNQGATARVYGEQALAINAPAIVNLGGLIRFGADQAATLQTDSLDNRQGHIQVAGGSLTLNSGTLNNTGGQIVAGNLGVTADTINNQNGFLVADAVTVNAARLDNSAKGLISAEKGALNLTVTNTFNNSQGHAQAGTDLNLRAGDVANQDGKLVGGQLTATLGSLSNNDAGVLSADAGKLTLTVAQQLNNAKGHLQAAQGDIELHAASLDNQGGAIIGKQLLLDARSGQIDNRAGRIVGDQLDVRAGSLDNRSAGLLAGGVPGVSVVLNDQLLNTQGRIQSEGDLLLTGKRLGNSAGILLGKALTVTAQDLDNSSKGALVSNDGDITLNISNLLTNTNGVIDAAERSVLVKALTTLDNQGGTLRGKRLDIAAQTLDNDQGQLLAGNQGVSYRGQDLSNRQGMILSGGAAVDLTLGTLNNQGGTVQGDSLTVTADSVDNSQDGTKAGALTALKSDLQLTVEALTNRGGKLFGKEHVTVSGATLDNSANGQISGNQLSLTSRTQLTNQGGLIESNQGLTFNGGNLDNSAGGQLRAMEGASSTLTVTDQLNNQNGILEFGSQAFSLSAGHLNNQAGQLQHAGTGVFSLNTSSLSGSQGSINGLGTADWSFGRVDGLGRVQLNEALHYTSTQGLSLKAGDRLASAKGLTLDVASLDNAGELLSDGDLSVNLTGDMTNSGRLSAQQKLSVVANNLSQNGGRLAGGTTTRITLGGTLDNLGYLTARQQLDIAAAQINNRGTLGSQGNVNLSASNGISNSADTLLFSGGDLTLRGNSFSNLYGDVYSKGNLSFAALDGGMAAGFSNLSGTVESEGNIGISARNVENAKAEFELGQTVTTGSLNWQCGQHCGGHDSFKRGQITINQTYLESAIKDSASARLVAGKDLLIQGDNVQNRYSLLAANGNLSITANDLLNQGAATRTGQNTIVIGTPQRIDTDEWDRMEYIDVPAFNAAVAAGNFDEARFEVLKARSSDWRFSEQSNVTTWTDNGGPGYTATIQAGGAVNLNVARTLQNGTLHTNTLEQLTGTLGDDQTGIPVGGININLSKHVNDATAQAPSSVLPVTSIAPDGRYVPVDYTGESFTPVDPTTAPGFQLPKGDYGLFIKNADPTSHYLIETNPNLTTVAGFFSSDYMLGKLGYSPDNAWRRLGDGQYESRLIRDAVLAQTGQRFLAGGLTSDYDQFRYLMDNALASKDALRLSVGVSLTDQQVGALTHDIVWMENRVVDGQTVLVPVLYLAQADSRNVRGNSLIQGRDLNLMTGGDLINVGTLRASNNLSVASSGSLYTGGLIEAGNNLSLLAQDSIRNSMAGEIRGTQVSLTTLKGDITNDNTAIQVRQGAGMRTLTDSSAGTITARENLAIDAGRDLTNHGALTAGGDADLKAGRDLNLIAVSDTSEIHAFSDGGHKSTITTDVKNQAATVTAGGNLSMVAGQDVNVIGSNATAGKDLNIQAGRDFNVASVSDVHNVEGKEKDGKKRIKTADEQATQLASVLTAGRDFTSQAGRDTTLVASKISAGNEAYLYSGDKLNLLAAQNSTHTLYDMKEKGSWGAKKAQTDEVTRTTQMGTEIKTGGNLTLKSEGDQLYQVAKLNSGKDIVLDSGGAVVFEGVKDLHDESHTKSKSDLSWFSAKGKGNTDETLRQSELVAQGQLVIKAAEGIRIDVKQVDQQTVSQTVDAMVKADPNLAWLKQAEARGDIDWRQVKEIHESFKYDNSGLGAGAKIAIAIMMAAIMGPAGFGLGGWELAVATSFSTTGVTSTINNKGNLGRALKETASSNSIKSAAVAGFTAGALSYADTNWFSGTESTSTTAVQGVSPSAGSTLAVTNSSSDIFTWTSAGDIALRAGGRAVISSGISTAIQGGSFGDNFNAALLGEAGNVAMATGFNWVGDYVTFPNGSPQKILAHALMGGLLAEATGSDFKTGAAAAGLNEALINQLVWAAQGNNDITLMLSQLTGLIGAAAVDGDLEKGSQIAQKATTFNYLYHEEVEQMLREVDSKSTEKEKREVRQRYEELDQQRNDELDTLCARDPQRCRGIATSLANDDQKLVDLVGRLRAQGQGGAASVVGYILGNNLDASNRIAADLGSAGGGVLVKLSAEAIKAGVGVTLPSRAGAGKGKGGQGDAATPDLPLGAKDTTRFIDGIKVVDQKTGQVLQGTVDLGPTLDRIKSGGSFPHRNDGSIFQNRASDLPQKPAGYYTEYVHPTPGIAGPGPQRIVVGKGGEMYYTADHYKTFIPIKN